MTPSTPATSVKKGRFFVNLTWNAVSFVVGMAVGIWYTPYLVRSLGTGGYGLIPLATTLVDYMGLVALGLNAGVGRNLTLAVERKQYDEANRVFSTTFWGNLVLVGILAVVGFVASCFGEHLIRAPLDMEVPVRWLMAGAVAAFLLNLLATPFGTATYCLNRFDISNSLAILQRLLQIGFVVLLFHLRGPSLYVISGALVFAAVVNLARNVAIQKHLLPFIRLNRAFFDIRVLWELCSFGGWIVVNWVGATLYLAIDLLVVNRMLGWQAGGRYALAMQWSGFLRNIGAVVSGTFGPPILYLYAGGDISGLALFGRRAVKLMGLAIAFPIGIICGLAKPILLVWLRSEEFVSLAPLMLLLTCHLCINMAVQPLFNIQVATGRVRLPAIVTCVMGIMNLGLAIVLCGPVGLGSIGVALAGCILLTAKNAVFTPIYGAHILKLPWWTFVREIGLTAAVTAVVALVCYAISRGVNVASWPGLIATGTVTGLLYSLAAWFVLLTAQERRMCRERIPWLGRHSESLVAAQEADAGKGVQL